MPLPFFLCKIPQISMQLRICKLAINAKSPKAKRHNLNFIAREDREKLQYLDVQAWLRHIYTDSVVQTKVHLLMWRGEYLCRETYFNWIQDLLSVPKHLHFLRLYLYTCYKRGEAVGTPAQQSTHAILQLHFNSCTFLSLFLVFHFFKYTNKQGAEQQFGYNWISLKGRKNRNLKLKYCLFKWSFCYLHL